MRRVFASATQRCLSVSRRTVFLEESTKGKSQMRHLDLYARRDPQLAPYLLREVDIEWKRRCRKVNFVFWCAVFTFLACYDERLTLEGMHFLKLFADQAALEQEKRDEDMNHRRQRLVDVMNVVKTAYLRDKSWRSSDLESVKQILKD